MFFVINFKNSKLCCSLYLRPTVFMDVHVCLRACIFNVTLLFKILGLNQSNEFLLFRYFWCFPVKTVILANVRPFRDKLIYFGCLFNPFMPEEFSKMKWNFRKKISLKSRKIRKSDAREMRKRQKRSKFHADHFQSGTFSPISNRKGAMTS